MAFHGGLLGARARLIALRAAPRLCRCSRSSISPAAVAPIGLFFGRLANFIKPELWGRPTDVPWAMVFPGAGPLPRHPSQLYEAGLKGVALFVVAHRSSSRAAACGGRASSPALFGAGYGVARIFCEFFREPDPAARGARRRPDDGHAAVAAAVARRASVLIVVAHARRRRRAGMSALGDASCAMIAPGRADPARALHGAGARPSDARLLHDARSVRRGRRFHHRAGDQPDVRRA